MSTEPTLFYFTISVSESFSSPSLALLILSAVAINESNLLEAPLGEFCREPGLWSFTGDELA